MKLIIAASNHENQTLNKIKFVTTRGGSRSEVRSEAEHEESAQENA